MALHNVYTSGNYILAQDDDGVATSELITQELVDNDFVGANNLRALWQLNNISNLLSSADTLIYRNISPGDIIIIRTNDGTYTKFIVPSVTPVTTADQIPRMISNTLPAGTGESSVNGTAYRGLDGDPATYHQMTNGWATGWISYRFKDDVPIQIDSYYLHGSGFNTVDSWTLQGSNNGLDWTIIDTRTNTESPNATYTVTTPGLYNRYRISTYSYYAKCYRFSLFGPGFEVDTTAVTQGETPDQAYLFSDNLYVNDVLAGYPNYTYEEIEGVRLRVFSQYDDIVIPNDGSGDGDGSRTLTTKVEFSAVGNLVQEITFDAYAATSPTPPFSVSKATAIGNAVTVYFPSDMYVTGDLTLSCSISIDSGTVKFPDTATANSNYIVFNYPADTIVEGNIVEFIYDSAQSNDINQVGTDIELTGGTYQVINSLAP